MAGPATLWLLAGVDPGGGAGLWRDQATARACAPELWQAPIVTAWTRQGAGAPATSQPRDAAHVLADLAAQPTPAAIKVGLLPAGLVAAVLPELAATGAPVVLDPVLLASDGGDLGANVQRLVDVLRDMSSQTARWLVTPNRAEAAALAGVVPDDPDLLARLAERLAGPALLLKDGHGEDATRVRDRLWTSGVVYTLARARQPGPDPRGTGCALATAIACGLARGRPLRHAVSVGVAWLDAVRGWTNPGPDGRAHLPDAGPPLPA
jgi:hydroxymethylpyrimidine kinase/phosphomethylpyrimidine kinase